ILPAFSDVCYHFIFDPVPLLPIPCGFRWRPMLPVPGSFIAHHAIWANTLGWNGCAYAACFIHRHEVVVPPGSPGKSANAIEHNYLQAAVAFLFLIAPLLSRTSGFVDDELRRIYCCEISIVYVYIGYCFLCFGLAIIFLVLLSSHIFFILIDVSRTRS
ncbi:hypothetical protein PMAYCL1PPCAC_05292, partial [Pristionchus mayeri]